MGDYTRFTFKPKKRYAAVLMQQGRVQLDADWNEKVEIGKRRWEIQAIDTFGHCAVPKTTPTGFQVGIPSGSPSDFDIGAGRMYVDGLLAELFEGETFNTDPISYLNQPFYPNPAALPATCNVILDVWEREITAIEDPDLLEKALGGPDTTTRLQTVWQVKVRDVATGGPAACGADLGSGISGGQLSTRIAPPPPDADPCILPPTAGYRGLENQLYRVEVHTAGALGTATFKWSRDNASLVAAVDAIVTSGGQSTLTVSRIGYDAVRRFQMGDWIEILDDHRELREEGRIMAQIAAPPNEADSTITLDRAILGGTFDPSDASRHTRLRRWDQRSGVDADGLLTTSGAWSPLENGIEVQFGVTASGEFRIGDYWVFWARYVDGSIEILTAASPRGIIHHYCQLAAINGGSVRDCRPLWPSANACGCCCTITVGVGSESGADYADLASALAALPTVAPDPTVQVHICLLPGEYHLTAPVTIARDRVTVSGCGARSRIVPTVTAFHVTSNHVVLESLTVDGNVSPPMIEVLGDGCRLLGNRFRNTEGYAVVATGAGDLTVLENTIEGGLGMAVQGERATIARNHFDHGALRLRAGCQQVDVVENTITDVTGLAALLLGTRLPGDTALVLSEITLRNNRIWGASGSGIAADVTATATGAQAPLQILGLSIVENEIIDCVERAATWAPGSPPFGGIVLPTVHHLVIARNCIEDNGHEATVPVCGIYVARSRGFEAHGNQVLNNGPQAISASIPGPQGGIVLPDASVPVNLLPSAGPGGVPIAQPDGAAAALISGNTIVARRGLALLIKGMGPMLVEGNRLTSRDVIGRRAPGGPAAIEDLVGAALILNLGLPAYFFAALAALGFNAIVTGVSLGAVGAGDQRVVGGKVQFVDNTVTLDLTTGQVESVLADVIVFSMDDINASGNQTECVLPNDILLIDLLVMGITARTIGNGLTETPNRCGFSLLSQTAVMNTGADNQGTHCIRVTGPAGRTVDRDNLIVVPNAQLCPHG